MNHSRKIRQLPFICLFALTAFNGPHALADATSKEKLSMQLMYHELDMKNQKAKQEFKISLDIGDLESAYKACISKDANYESCRDATSRSSDRLHTRTNEAQLLAESKKQTELLKKQQEAQKENNTSVTIIDNSPDRYRWHRDRHDWDRPIPPPVLTPPSDAPRFTPKPGFVPQNKFQAGDGFSNDR